MTDVELLERDRLTSGTTWHAAGLMATFGSTSQTSAEPRMHTRDLYSRLEAETGLATGLEQVGLIEFAIEPGRLEEYLRVATFNRLCGVGVRTSRPSPPGPWLGDGTRLTSTGWSSRREQAVPQESC
jgi:4-methylaminobutanoate oxidase (formaldehyde-forming)